MMSRTVNRVLSRFVLASAICAVLLPLIFAASTSSSQGGVTVQLNKTDSPDPVNASGTLNYTITVYMIVNQSNVSNISNLVLTDTYPANVIFQTAQPSPISGTNNTFILGNFTANQTVLVNVSVLVRNVSNGTVLSNVANISYQNSTGTQLNLSVTENTTLLNPPLFNFSNISVAKTDTPDPVNASSNLTYAITVTSNGNGTAYNVTAVDTYPAEVVFLSAQPTPSSGNNTFIVGNLTNGTAFTINITVLVLNITNGTVINNSVNVTFRNETSALLSVIATASTTVTNLTFAAPAPAGQGGGSGGGGGGGVSSSRSYSLTTSPQTFQLRRLDKVLFTISVKQHSVQITNIMTNSVSFQVASTPTTHTVSKGASKEIDADGDGTADIRVTVKDISYYQTTFMVERLTAAACLENWDCADWGACVGGEQSHACTDLAACGTTTLRPPLTKACEVPKPVEQQSAPPEPRQAAAEPSPLPVPYEAPSRFSLDNLFYGIAVLALVGLGAYWYFQRRKK